MTITAFKLKLKNTPNTIAFAETMQVVDTYFDFTPTAFTNGLVQNAAGENSGSCKVFAFAKAEALSKTETLACFGQYYFDEVLKDPNGTGHQNIRSFIKTGFEGLQFDQNPLTKKKIL